MGWGHQQQPTQQPPQQQQQQRGGGGYQGGGGGGGYAQEILGGSGGVSPFTHKLSHSDHSLYGEFHVVLLTHFARKIMFLICIEI